MYIDIRRLKSKGFSNSGIAKMLGISRPTVIKYVNMDENEFESELESRKLRVKKPDIYRKEILMWLKQYPGMTSAQVYDWLEEKYQEIKFSEATLRSYIRELRIEHNIPKETKIREYEAVDELPMGQQMQVDFGGKKYIVLTGRWLPSMWCVLFSLTQGINIVNGSAGPLIPLISYEFMKTSLHILAVVLKRWYTTRITSFW